MARITIEDCLKQIPNRFELTLTAANRARVLSTSSASPLVDPGRDKPDKPTVIALREIAAGKVGIEMLNKQTANRITLNNDVFQEREAKPAAAPEAEPAKTSFSFVPAESSDDSVITPAALLDDDEANLS